jgi:hypothetical protein
LGSNSGKVVNVQLSTGELVLNPEVSSTSDSLDLESYSNIETPLYYVEDIFDPKYLKLTIPRPRPMYIGHLVLQNLAQALLRHLYLILLSSWPSILQPTSLKIPLPQISLVLYNNYLLQTHSLNH